MDVYISTYVSGAYRGQRGHQVLQNQSIHGCEPHVSAEKQTGSLEKQPVFIPTE